MFVLGKCNMYLYESCYRCVYDLEQCESCKKLETIAEKMKKSL